MSFKLFSLNSLVERKKPEETKDELAIVKAAAWAWYLHGSGSKAKAKNEFDVKRSQTVARPSRYKLEAMGMAKETPSMRTIKPLLDSYEVQRISKQLDVFIKDSGHNNIGNGCRKADNSDSKDNGNRRMKNKQRVTSLSVKCVPAVNLSMCLPKPNHAL
ncbi:uncharacterized protein LOC106757516 [Vigna radiata var. radiata]|uniref:Uncharacterized protein LOC106757516 n=1 Tax=Vigna radiata var. radiata TaxID=3916 RepID=A0A1S3TPJ3_VIGRR|nr:uncharacterized protein LOC106757516 [Vigna radiata var. radiata]